MIYIIIKEKENDFPFCKYVHCNVLNVQDTFVICLKVIQRLHLLGYCCTLFDTYIIAVPIRPAIVETHNHTKNNNGTCCCNWKLFCIWTPTVELLHLTSLASLLLLYLQSCDWLPCHVLSKSRVSCLKLCTLQII